MVSITPHAAIYSEHAVFTAQFFRLASLSRSVSWAPVDQPPSGVPSVPLHSPPSPILFSLHSNPFTAFLRAYLPSLCSTLRFPWASVLLSPSILSSFLPSFSRPIRSVLKDPALFPGMHTHRDGDRIYCPPLALLSPSFLLMTSLVPLVLNSLATGTST